MTESSSPAGRSSSSSRSASIDGVVWITSPEPSGTTVTATSPPGATSSGGDPGANAGMGRSREGSLRRPSGVGRDARAVGLREAALAAVHEQHGPLGTPGEALAEQLANLRRLGAARKDELVVRDVGQPEPERGEHRDDHEPRSENGPAPARAEEDPDSSPHPGVSALESER